jgi:hypothetical protein
LLIIAGNVNQRLGDVPITSTIEVGTDLSYPNIGLESSGQALRTSNLTPEAVHRLTDRRAIQRDHLNVIGVEDPSTGIKSVLKNVSVLR